MNKLPSLMKDANVIRMSLGATCLVVGFSSEGGGGRTSNSGGGGAISSSALTFV